MSFLTVSSVSRQIQRDFALSDISFSQGRHQKIAIAGETGSGKSTLLKIVAGLVQPDRGEVIFEGHRVKGPDETLVPGHPSIAYLSQNFELAKSLRVEQVLAYSNVLSEADARALFDVCQISHLLLRRTDQLSGGERQRIAICRLLISSPKLLLLDEPFSHLDMVHKNTLQAVIQDIGQRLKISLILVSHDPVDTLSWADRIAVLRDGALVQKGKPSTIYRRPVNEYVAGLFGKYNLIDHRQAKALHGDLILRRKKKIMVRPEDIRIKIRGKKSGMGVVSKVSFFGNYHLVDVAFQGGNITVRTEMETLKTGDAVFLSLAPEDVCYL